MTDDNEPCEVRTLREHRDAQDYANVAADLHDLLAPETPTRQCSLLALLVVAGIRAGVFSVERFIAETQDLDDTMERYPELLGLLTAALRDRTPLPPLPVAH